MSYRFYQGMDPDEADERALRAAAELIERNREELAALVIEPLMQGAAGMWAHSVRFLPRHRRTRAEGWRVADF